VYFPEPIIIWLPATVTVVVIAAILIYLSIKAHRGRVETGAEGIVGEEGVFRGGRAFVHGELWQVKSNEELAEGDSIVVEGVERMTLRVRKL